jgi:hypothetical protein
MNKEKPMYVRVTMVMALKGKEPFGKHPEALTSMDVLKGIDRMVMKSGDIQKLFVEKFEKLTVDDPSLKWVKEGEG